MEGIGMGATLRQVGNRLRFSIGYPPPAIGYR